MSDINVSSPALHLCINHALACFRMCPDRIKCSVRRKKVYGGQAVPASGGMFTLSIDGWTTKDCIPLIGFGMAGMLIGAVEEREAKHTSSHLATITEEQIPLLEQKFKCEIVAVVRDGASNMEGVQMTILPHPYHHFLFSQE